MKKAILLAIALTMVVFAIAACSPAPTATPTSVPPTAAPKPTDIPKPTEAPKPTATTAPPTALPQPTATTAPPTSAPQPSATTAQPAPATAAPTAPPTPAVSPGLYVTAMRLEPSQPSHGQDTSFFVTFLNTASTEQNLKWQVYIYKADNPVRRNNETTGLQTTFTPGPIELKAIGTFKFGATGNQCDFFFARVVWLDINNKGNEFTKPDGQVFERGFSVCQ